MESNPDPNPRYLRWLSKRTSVVLLTALGLFLLVFQVNKMLSSSFRIEIFGVEILEVQHLDDQAPAPEGAVVEAPVIRRQLPPAPPLLPMPPDTPEAPEAHSDTYYFVVEQMPCLLTSSGECPENSSKALFDIQRQMKYPELAKRAGIEGRVIIQFIVDEAGNVSEAAVVRGIGGSCDEEALRVVRKAQFRPGKQRGKSVKVKMSLPLTFKLQ